MKKKVLAVSVLILICILTACNFQKTERNAHSNTKESVTSEMIKIENPYPFLNGNEVVFIKVYSNWAEGYQYDATYVTANGNVYSYVFSGAYGSNPYSVDDVFSFPLNDVIRTYSTDEMTEMLYSLEHVGKIEFKKVDYACDYGSNTVYGVVYDKQGNRDVLKLGTFGDVHSIPNDENAVKICKLMGVEWD